MAASRRRGEGQAVLEVVSRAFAALRVREGAAPPDDGAGSAEAAFARAAEAVAAGELGSAADRLEAAARDAGSAAAEAVAPWCAAARRRADTDTAAKLVAAYAATVAASAR